MRPIEFKGQNVIFAKDQPEYLPLPAMMLPGETGDVISCWELTDDEIEVIKKTKCFYLKQLTFNNPIQPILPMAELGNDIVLI